VSGGKSHDLVVIGSGTTTQVASFRVRAAGWSVAVIGGTCALRGCDPKQGADQRCRGDRHGKAHARPGRYRQARD
jgi:hypothetical protein